MNTELDNLKLRVEGKVIKYDAQKSFGFIRIISQDYKLNNRDAFIYYKDIEPEKNSFKKLVEGQLVEFDLYKRDKGFVAKNLSIIEGQNGNFN